MTPRRLLHRLRDAGFRVGADGDELVVAPAPNLTSDLRQQIRNAKPELLDLTRAGVGTQPVDCVDCGRYLPLSGVRCPGCRDSYSKPTCASCGAVIEGPDLSICDLCEIERQVAEARYRRMSQVEPEAKVP